MAGALNYGTLGAGAGLLGGGAYGLIAGDEEDEDGNVTKSKYRRALENGLLGAGLAGIPAAAAGAYVGNNTVQELSDKDLQEMKDIVNSAINSGISPQQSQTYLNELSNVYVSNPRTYEGLPLSLKGEVSAAYNTVPAIKNKLLNLIFKPNGSSIDDQNNRTLPRLREYIDELKRTLNK
jgi:hypothetical protein